MDSADWIAARLGQLSTRSSARALGRLRHPEPYESQIVTYNNCADTIAKKPKSVTCKE
jgi:hypothetical protein